MSAILDTLRAKLKRAPAAVLASTEIAAEIERRRADLAAARVRITAAAGRRQSALDALDETGMAEADADATAAARAVEIAERAIGLLEAPFAEAIGVERREKFHADVAATKRRSAEVQKRLENEYDAAAEVIGSILNDLQDYHDYVQFMYQRARELGEAVELPDPEFFTKKEPVYDLSHRLLYAIPNLPGLRRGDGFHWYRRGQ